MKKLTIEELCQILEYGYDAAHNVQKIVNKLEDFDVTAWGKVHEIDKDEVVKFWSQYLPLEIYNPLYA